MNKRLQIRASKDPLGSGYDTETGHSISVLLGKRNDSVLALYARHLVELIAASAPTRYLLLGIALKDNRYVPTLPLLPSLTVFCAVCQQ